MIRYVYISDTVISFVMNGLERIKKQNELTLEERQSLKEGDF
ncbi:MAG: hypothetical protein WBP64_08590 [Nitrososphaeraceae archaeon]